MSLQLRESEQRQLYLVQGYTQEQIEKFYPAQSPSQRLEDLNVAFDKLPKYAKRNEELPWNWNNNVTLIRGFWEDGVYVRDFNVGHNIITNHGRNYYALLGAKGTPAANEGATRIQLSNPTTQNPVNLTDTWDQFDSAPAGNGAAGSGAALSDSNIVYTTNYPRVSDPDTDNTGAGTNVISYQGFWGSGIATAATTFIKNGCLLDIASPVAATKIPSHFQTTTTTGVQKNATDTLKGMLNHTVSSS